jgi:K(+)-stimulated pyrophosphate-energized sodium pump
MRMFIHGLRTTLGAIAAFAIAVLLPAVAYASEAELKLPDLRQVKFLGIDGWTLLASGIVVCIGGLLFGFYQYNDLRKLPVHRAMRYPKRLEETIY